VKKTLEQIKKCLVCSGKLPHLPRPVLSVASSSKILIIGQAPGRIVHATGIPWNDKSGEQLRTWLNVSSAQFYDVRNFGIVPMGFCYPGKGKSGDLPPRPECAPTWHPHVMLKLKKVQLTILVGAYAQRYYLRSEAYPTLTDTVRNFRRYLPDYFPIVHPSPRNGIWLRKNTWFTDEVVPELQQLVHKVLSGT
jgi:uracil-DNA glycosylase